MELRQVAYAIAVVDQGGFGKAALELGVAQPSLSAGIKALERSLGTPLFHRLGRGVALTAAGEAFVPAGRRLLADAAVAREAVASVAGLRAGRLDIVALPTLAVDPLAALIGRFRQAHPGVAVRLLEPEGTAEVIERVGDGTCELGVTELPAAELVEIPLGDQAVLAVCPPGTRLPRGRLPVARLATMALVASPPGTSTRRLVDAALGAAHLTATLAVEVDQREAILPLVLAGAGVSFLPEPQARAAAGAGAVVAPLDPPLRRRIGLVHRRGPLSPAAAAFVLVAGLPGRRRDP